MTGWVCHDTSLGSVRDEGVNIMHYHDRFYFLTIYEQIVIADPHVDTVQADEVLHPDVQVHWFAIDKKATTIHIRGTQQSHISIFLL